MVIDKLIKLGKCAKYQSTIFHLLLGALLVDIRQYTDLYVRVVL